jgi:hypothetical protein
LTLRILLAAFALLPILSHAAGEVPTSEVLYVATWPTHVDVQMNTTYITTEGCGAAADFYRIDLQNDPSASAKLATLLTAFASGKPLGLSIGGCVGDRPKIAGVRFYR